MSQLPLIFNKKILEERPIIRNLILFLLIIIPFSLIVNLDYFFSNINEDEYTYIFIGRALNDGKTLYKDVIAFKGPLIFFFYQIISFVIENSIFLLKFFGIIINLLWISFFYYKELLNNTNLKTIFSILFLILVLSFLPYDNNILTENFSNIIFTLLILFLIKERKKNDYYFICLFLATLIAFRQNYFFILPPIFILIFYELRQNIKKILFTILFFLLCTTLFFAYYYIFYFDEFVMHFYIAPKLWIGNNEFIQIFFNVYYNIKKIISYLYLDPVKSLTILLIFIYSVFKIYFSNKQYQKFLNILIFMSLFLLFSTLISERFFSHYLVMIYPVSFFILSKIMISLNKKHFYLFSIIFIILFTYKFQANLYDTDYHFKNKSEKEVNKFFQNKNIFKNNILSDSNEIYFELNNYPPGKIFHLGHYNREKYIKLFFNKNKDQYLKQAINSSEYIIIKKNETSFLQENFNINAFKNLIFENKKYLIYN